MRHQRLCLVVIVIHFSYESIFEPARFPLKMKSCARYLNMSALVRRLNIQQSLLAAYISGSKRPSDARGEDILKAIHEIGADLMAL